jgi:hypothetical protein
MHEMQCNSDYESDLIANEIVTMDRDFQALLLRMAAVISDPRRFMDTSK